MVARSHAAIELGFLLRWVLANTLGLTVGGVAFALSFLATMPLLIMGLLFATGIWWILSGVLLGSIVGLIQWLVLRRYFYTSPWWIAATTAGWSLTSVVMGMTQFSSLSDVGLVVLAAPTLGWAGIGAVAGLSTSIAQSFALKLQRQETGLWIISNGVGWSLALSASWEVTLATNLPMLGPLSFVCGIIGGAMTGLALVWILHRSILPSASTTPVSSGLGTWTVRPFHFKTSDVVGDVGLLGMMTAVWLFAVGHTTYSGVIFALSIMLLIYALVNKRRA